MLQTPLCASPVADEMLASVLLALAALVQHYEGDDPDDLADEYDEYDEYDDREYMDRADLVDDDLRTDYLGDDDFRTLPY